MPKLELGDLESVDEAQGSQHPACWRSSRARATRSSRRCPRCTLMFKQELPLMFPDDADVQAVQEAMFDPFEYLMARNARRPAQDRFQAAARQGGLPRALPLARAEHRPRRRARCCSWCPAPRSTLIERCSGHAGTWGVKKRVPREVDEDRQAGVHAQMAEPAARLHQLRLPARRRTTSSRASSATIGTRAASAHPLTLLRIAYGLE